MHLPILAVDFDVNMSYRGALKSISKEKSGLSSADYWAWLHGAAGHHRHTARAGAALFLSDLWREFLDE